MTCADPGIFVRGGGGGGGGPGQPDKKVNLEESYHFSRFQREYKIFRGGGSNCLLPIETHITCDFPGGWGGSDPCPPPPLWIRT